MLVDPWCRTEFGFEKKVSREDTAEKTLDYGVRCEGVGSYQFQRYRFGYRRDTKRDIFEVVIHTYTQ